MLVRSGHAGEEDVPVKASICLAGCACLNLKG